MEIRDIMLTAPNSVKAGSYITNDVSDEMIGASIREAQDIHLQSIIGSNLLERLKTLVFNYMNGGRDKISDQKNVAYKDLLDGYVEPYLIAKTQALICVPITFKIRNMGVVYNTDTNVNNNGLEQAYAAQRRFNTLADQRATKLSMYLCSNKDSFPELFQGDCGCSDYVRPLIGRRFVNVHLNLGNKQGDCCC
jgi:hypothetical protein